MLISGAVTDRIVRDQSNGHAKPTPDSAKPASTVARPQTAALTLCDSLDWCRSSLLHPFSASLEYSC